MKKHLATLFFIISINKKFATLSIASGLLGGLLPTLITIITALLVNAITTASATRSESTWYVIFLIGSEAAISLLIIIKERFMSALTGSETTKTKQELTRRVLIKTASLELSERENSKSKQAYDFVTRYGIPRAVYLPTRITSLATSLTSLGGATLVTMKTSPYAGIFVILFALPTFFLTAAVESKKRGMQNNFHEDYARSSYIELLLTNLLYAKEVLFFGLKDKLINLYDAYNHKINKKTNDHSWFAIYTLFTSDFLGVISVYAVYCATAVAAAQGKVSIGSAASILLCCRQVQSSFSLFLTTISSLQSELTEASSVPQYILDDPNTAANRPALPCISSEEKGIVFENVWFKYPDTEDYCLCNINFCIPPKSSFAIVGINGAGKTTLLKLICGLYKPTRGQARLDGVDIYSIDRAYLRTRMSAIFQDYAKYQFPVDLNIGIGAVGEPREERLWWAAECASASDLIKKLPAGLDTQLGRAFKGGIDLSGGEWQRIAAARAYAPDADVLVLDEPTASLDVVNEMRLTNEFLLSKKSKTVILVSHRFGSVRRADQIALISEGTISEIGSHDELMSLRSGYHYLFNTHAEQFFSNEE